MAERARTVRVAIVSDIRLYRDGLAAILDGRRGIRVVGTARGPDDGIRMVGAARPDTLLLDLATTEGVAGLRALAGAVCGLGIVVVGLVERPGDVIDCIEAGAMGYLTRDASLDDTVDALERVAGGETFCSPRMAAVLLGRLQALAAERRTGWAPSEAAGLTARELEVAALIDNGLSNREIATRLCIQTATVKNHVHNLLRKLDARSRGEAAARLRSRAAGMSLSA